MRQIQQQKGEDVVSGRIALIIVLVLLSASGTSFSETGVSTNPMVQFVLIAISTLMYYAAIRVNRPGEVNQATLPIQMVNGWNVINYIITAVLQVIVLRERLSLTAIAWLSLGSFLGVLTLVTFHKAAVALGSR
ncbi:hypothetical protein HYW61_01400 [candidate division WWE3 bacterium]|nr:hypothetical protein [candidate division WWE3 bacterium]